MQCKYIIHLTSRLAVSSIGIRKIIQPFQIILQMHLQLINLTFQQTIKLRNNKKFTNKLMKTPKVMVTVIVLSAAVRARWTGDLPTLHPASRRLPRNACGTAHP